MTSGFQIGMRWTLRQSYELEGHIRFQCQLWYDFYSWVPFFNANYFYSDNAFLMSPEPIMILVTCMVKSLIEGK